MREFIWWDGEDRKNEWEVRGKREVEEKWPRDGEEAKHISVKDCETDLQEGGPGSACLSPLPGLIVSMAYAWILGYVTVKWCLKSCSRQTLWACVAVSSAMRPPCLCRSHFPPRHTLWAACLAHPFAFILYIFINCLSSSWVCLESSFGHAHY